MCLNTKDLNKIFQRLDKNGDGLLSVEELNWLLEKIGVYFSLKELELSVGKSSLDFNEFLNFYDSISKQKDDDDNNGVLKDEIVEEEQDEENKEEIYLTKAFNVFDLNGDGFITSEELENVLARLELWDSMNGKDCRSMIRAYDTNFDGVLDFQEFKNMMLQTNL